MSEIHIDEHPLLHSASFDSEFPEPLGSLASPAWLTELLALDATAPLQRDEAVRVAVRDLLRSGGYKPTGRGKPASEYLVRAAREGVLGSINVPVDTCNAVSLHSGLPISVIDLDRAEPPFRIGIAEQDEHYIFNTSGQEIDVGGLLCLCDVAGPCANAVRDAQRTKTNAETRRTLSVIWGCIGHEDRVAAAVDWYCSLLHQAGAETRQ